MSEGTMRIERLIVKNFRSFDETGIEVVLPDIKQPISIVGHNNSGKSNLINAILYGLHHKSTYGDAFDQFDFHNCVTNNDFLIEVHISPPIKCGNAYAKVNEITSFHLKGNGKGGVISCNHICHGADGEPVRSPTAIKASPKLGSEDKRVINAMHRAAGETAYKNKDKIPLIYIDTLSTHEQLKANRFTLLGRVLGDIKREFESKLTVVSNGSDIFEKHRGRPNAEVLTDILNYIEKKIIPTPKLEQLTNQIRDSIKEELELEGEDFQLGFGLPSVDAFYKDLEFWVKDGPNKQRLPISRFGNGFISLFVISMLKAINETNSGGKIIVIEEPETFLHEHYQEYFYNMLVRLSQNNQVIYTTHSKKFVNVFMPTTIVKVETPGFTCSKIIHPKNSVEFPETIGNYQVKNIDDFAMYLRTLEPNIGNIIFARKVIIVEGPHDILAYKTVLSTAYNLEFHNVSIVAAWGKDTLRVVVQICKLFNIDFFVIHDFDIPNDCDNTLSIDHPESVYSSLSPSEKAQYTKNLRIISEAGVEKIHHNKPKLEGVLSIQNKSSASVFEAVKDKSLDEIMKQFPKFLPQTILDFLGPPKSNAGH
jgi:putative ATP-dependent endonuclease of OLD family